MLSILFLIVPLFGFSQIKEIKLRSKFMGADSVVLVSHDDTQGVAIVDSLGNNIPLPKLIIGAKPNYAIIKERKVLNSKQIDTLIRILARPFSDKRIETYKCYMPHHSIFIFKNGKISFIDLCFWCHGFETSSDLNKFFYAFDNQKWEELESFFKQFEFKYKLDSFEE